ncbi:MAG: hypothetical protein KF770_19580 [Anaerolineae bacterium]|nr:hypothetical protein [Anaerolineae bacterium]
MVTVATAVSITTGVSVAGGWVGVGGTAVFVSTTATRVGGTVATSLSTLHPASSKADAKINSNRIVFMATSRGEL